jgi:hypothetical protein
VEFVLDNLTVGVNPDVKRVEFDIFREGIAQVTPDDMINVAVDFMGPVREDHTVSESPDREKGCAPANNGGHGEIW